MIHQASMLMDLACSRLLLHGMTDWTLYVHDMFNMLKPGGWSDFGDHVEDIFYAANRSQPRDDWECLRAIGAGGLRKGLDLDCGTHIQQYLKAVRFVDIQRWEYRVPIWMDVTRDGGEQPEARQCADSMIDNKWGQGMGYDEEGIGRLKKEMLCDMRN